MMEFFSGQSESDQSREPEQEDGAQQPQPERSPEQSSSWEPQPKQQRQEAPKQQQSSRETPDPEPVASGEEPTTEESGSRLKKLLETMVHGIVDYPEGIQIQELSGEASIFFEMRVHDDDVGKVIGRNGRIINSMRTILKAAGGRDNRQVELKLLSDD